jgi:hypothetical protein
MSHTGLSINRKLKQRAMSKDMFRFSSSDVAVRLAYEEIARRWREMAERAERNNW